MRESLTTNTATYNPDRAWAVNQVVVDISDHTLDRLSAIAKELISINNIKHGYWKDFHCSVCGKMGWDMEDAYCPNCGAQMDIERKEND